MKLLKLFKPGKKANNLKDVLKIDIQYSPKKLEFNNVGTYSSKVYGK